MMGFLGVDGGAGCTMRLDQMLLNRGFENGEGDTFYVLFSQLKK